MYFPNRLTQPETRRRFFYRGKFLKAKKPLVAAVNTETCDSIILGDGITSVSAARRMANAIARRNAQSV